MRADEGLDVEGGIERSECGGAIMFVHADDETGKGKSGRIAMAVRYCSFGMADRRRAVLLAQSTAHEEAMMAFRGIGVRQRISRIERERALQKQQRFRRTLRGFLNKRRAGLAENEIVGVEAIWPFALDTFDLRQTQTWLDCADNG